MPAYVTQPTRDSAWIINKALSRIGAASVANPASAEDYQLAQDQLEVTAQDLMDRGVCYIPDLDAVKASYATWLAERVAIDLKADFGYPVPDGQSALRPVSMVEITLRRLSADEPSYGPQVVSFV